MIVTPEQQAWLDQYNANMQRLRSGGNIRAAAERFRQRRPTGEEVMANPDAYGMSPEWIAAQQQPQQPQQPLPQPPPTMTKPGGLLDPGVTGPTRPMPNPGLPIENPMGYPTTPTLPPPSGPSTGGAPAIGGEPNNPNLPITPGGPPQSAGSLASWGYTRGPNGEIMPVQLSGGFNPMQQSPSLIGGLLDGSIGANPQALPAVTLPQMQFDPTRGGYSWFTPANPDPSAPPAAGTPPGTGAPQQPPQIAPPMTGPGAPGFGPIIGEPPIDSQQPKGLLGLLGPQSTQLPPALRGLLG